MYEFLWGLRSWVFSGQVIPHFSFDVIHGHHSSWSQVDSVCEFYLAKVYQGTGTAKAGYHGCETNLHRVLKKIHIYALKPCPAHPIFARQVDDVQEPHNWWKKTWDSQRLTDRPAVQEEEGEGETLKLKGCLFGSAPWTLHLFRSFSSSKPSRSAITWLRNDLEMLECQKRSIDCWLRPDSKGMYTLKVSKWFTSNTLHINAKNLYLWKVHFDGPHFKSKKWL